MAAKEKIPLTIVVPAYGRPVQLSRALSSIVDQDVEPTNVIVVDDGSSPLINTDSLSVSGMRPTVIRHAQNRGPAAARNTGIKAADTEWISFLDSDDYLISNTLGARWRLLQSLGGGAGGDAAQGKQISGCSWIDWSQDSPKQVVRHPRPSNRLEDFASGCWFSPGSCIIMNRHAIVESGVLQDEGLRRFEDFDWFLALAYKGFVFRSGRIVGVAIERTREQSPAKVEPIAKAIVRKWGAEPEVRPVMSRIGAYMDLECAAANHYAGNYARASAFLARSLLGKPRLSLQLSPGWETEPPAASGRHPAPVAGTLVSRRRTL